MQAHGSMSCITTCNNINYCEVDAKLEHQISEPVSASSSLRTGAGTP